MKLLQGEMDEARDHLSEMRQVGVAIDSLHHRLFAMAHTGMVLSLSARYDEARVALEEAMAEARGHGAKQFAAESMAMIEPYRLAGVGDLEGAYDIALEGIELSRQISDVQHLAWGQFSAGLVARMTGRYDRALEHLGEARAVAAAIGNPGLVHGAMAIEAVIRLEIEGPESSEGSRLGGLAEVELTTGGMGGTLATLTMAERADAAVRHGDLEHAESLIERGLRSLGSTRIVARPNLLLCRGSIALVRNDGEALARAITEAETFLAEHPVAWSMPRLHALKGSAALLADDPGADEEVRRSVTPARELHLLPDLASIHDMLALASDRAGQESIREDHRQAADGVRSEILEGMTDGALQATYRATLGLCFTRRERA